MTITDREKRDLLATCVAAAAKSTEIIRAGAERRESLVWESKARSDFVSDVDRDSEHALSEIIRARHPNANLVAEEGSPNIDSLAGLTFVADPLDGTTNFLHGFPWYAVSIAAVVDGELAAGVVLNAATGELFTATAGGGARSGGRPISVSKITEPNRSLIGTGIPFKSEQRAARYLEILPQLMTSIAGIRRAGSAALDLSDVACGRFEGFFELLLSPWDIAAGLLLVREAGGIVTDVDGKPCPIARTSVVAGNATMHAWLLERVRPST